MVYVLVYEIINIFLCFGAIGTLSDGGVLCDIVFMENILYIWLFSSIFFVIFFSWVLYYLFKGINVMNSEFITTNSPGIIYFIVVIFIFPRMISFFFFPISYLSNIPQCEEDTEIIEDEVFDNALPPIQAMFVLFILFTISLCLWGGFIYSKTRKPTV